MRPDDPGPMDIVYVSTEDDVHLVKGGIGTAVGLFADAIRDHFPSCRVHWITESPEPGDFTVRSGSVTRHYLNRFRDGAKLPLSEFCSVVDRRLDRLLEAISAEGRDCVVEAPDWEGLAARLFTGTGAANVLKVSRLHTPLAVCSRLNQLPDTAQNATQLLRERSQLLASDLLSAPTRYVLERTVEEVLRPHAPLPPSAVVPNCAPVRRTGRPRPQRAEALAHLNRISGLALPEAAFHVFVVGSLEPRKGARIVQQAIAPLFARFPDCHLTWIGHIGDSGDLNANTKIGARSFLEGIPPQHRARVHLAGYVAHQSLLEVLAAADLYALCYLGDNFPGALLEIALAEVPLVLLPRGGVPEMVEGRHGPLAFMVDDTAEERIPECVASAVADARGAPELARARAAALRRHVEEAFHPVVVTSRLLGVYRRHLEVKTRQRALET